VLGANDGLCSNLSLVMGVAGAAVNRHGILITGFAGLIAGACSMARARFWRQLGFPNLVKARAVRKANMERRKLEKERLKAQDQLRKALASTADW
jgi:vacuolar iron transporter family protein